jgi:hypothetical protein
MEGKERPETLQRGNKTKKSQSALYAMEIEMKKLCMQTYSREE